MSKVEWEVIVYDKPGSDRSIARDEHVKNIPALVNAGIVTSAGAIYKDVAKTQFAGSTLHIVAESKEEVIEILKQDVYYKKGIWDIDSVIAHPAGIAVRLPKKLPGVTIGFE